MCNCKWLKKMIIIFVIPFIVLICYHGEGECNEVTIYNSAQIHKILLAASHMTNKYQCGPLMKSNVTDFDHIFKLTLDDFSASVAIKDDGTDDIKEIWLCGIFNHPDDPAKYAKLMIYLFNLVGISEEAWNDGEKREYEKGGIIIRPVWNEKIQKDIQLNRVRKKSDTEDLIAVIIKSYAN